MEEHDDLFSMMANAKADLILGKNLSKHLLDTIELIKAMNMLVDGALLTNTDADGFMKLGYEYYRLKDEIIIAMGEKP